MAKYLVQVGIVSYSDVVIEASNPDEAYSKAVKLMPSDLEAMDADYQGWDLISAEVNEDELIEF